MNLVSALLLALSTLLASLRNIMNKSFSGFSIKNREFFGLQATIFGCGSIALLLVNLFDFQGISLYTFFLALLYGGVLLSAQWFYTIALTKGKIAICATLYSFGFVFPTLAGFIVWDEEVTVFGILGILAVIPVLIISGTRKKEEKKTNSLGFLIPLIIALVCSGGLGILQKIQQTSEYKNQRSTFILIAFLFAFITSLLFFLFKKKGDRPIDKRSLGFCTLVGVFFSVCNLLNTYLAGKLDSSVFFPILNISSILMSVLLGFIIYKERLTKKDIFVLCLGTIAIILVNL